MLEILKYTTSGFWVFIGSYALIIVLLYCLVEGTLKITGRFFRMVMVLCRNWPPNHLDADGDWKPKN